MKTSCKIILTGIALGAVLCIGQAATVEVGKPAPDFSLTDIKGTNHSLSDYRGRVVVLEWVNPECPIVMKHYDRSGNMPRTQKAAAADGVVWLQINSGHPGAQGDYDAAKVAEWQKRQGTVSTAYFRDQDGKVGRLYDARTTPHMFVIDGNGTLVYAGGIDSIRSGNPADIAKATNYVTAALTDLKARRPVRTQTSQPYGCGIKYRD